MDRGAWRARVHGVTKSRTQMTRVLFDKRAALAVLGPRPPGTSWVGAAAPLAGFANPCLALFLHCCLVLGTPEPALSEPAYISIKRITREVKQHMWKCLAHCLEHNRT